MNDEIFWVMDSDICEECGELLDDFGMCIGCGYDGMSDVEWEECDYDDMYDEMQWAMGEYP